MVKLILKILSACVLLGLLILFEDKILIIGIYTLIVATLTFLAMTTDLFKKRIPIAYGFSLDKQIENNIDLSTGDEAKPILLGFRNTSETTLTGVILDIMFLKPIVLSATQTALTYFPGKTIHGRTEDGSYYWIRYSELSFVGNEEKNFRVELNTKGQSPGTYKVIVSIYSTQQVHKFKKSELQIHMR